MKKLMNKKGFTLIEMLVVIAIIAVLVAIIVPTVTSATGKAAAATNAANLRTYIAELAVAELNGDITITAGASEGAAATITAKEGKTAPIAPTMKNVGNESYGTVQVIKAADGTLTAQAPVNGENAGTKTLTQFATYAEKGAWS